MGCEEGVIAEHRSNVVLNEPGQISAGLDVEFGSPVNCFFACHFADGSLVPPSEAFVRPGIPFTEIDERRRRSEWHGNGRTEAMSDLFAAL